MVHKTVVKHVIHSDTVTFSDIMVKRVFLTGYNQTHRPSSAPSLTIQIQHTEWADQGHPRTAPGGGDRMEVILYSCMLILFID